MESSRLPGLACILVPVFIALAPAPVQAEDIAGIVVDAEDGSPLQGTYVQILDAAGRVIVWGDTDAAGRFQLTGLAAENYSILVIRMGYATRTMHDIRAGSAAT